MFGFFKRKPKPTHIRPVSTDNYPAEFRRLTQVLYDKFAILDTPYDVLLDAMSAVENEMNRNGGGNWNENNYGEYLDSIEDRLLADNQFTAKQQQQIRWSLNEIAECGRELRENGESSRSIDEPINYLIARVVDWCRTHPPQEDSEIES
jgi:hypothetical protein